MITKNNVSYPEADLAFSYSNREETDYVKLLFLLVKVDSNQQLHSGHPDIYAHPQP